MARDRLYEKEIEVQIQKCVSFLSKYSKGDREWSDVDHLAIERSLQVLIEALIGFSRYFLETVFEIRVSRSREAIDELHKKRVFKTSLYQELSMMVSFRNVLVHDYLNLNVDVVISIVKKSRFLVAIEVLQLLKTSLDEKMT